MWSDKRTGCGRRRDVCSQIFKGLEYWCLKVNRVLPSVTSVYCLGGEVTTIALIVPGLVLVMQANPPPSFTFLYALLIFHDPGVLVDRNYRSSFRYSACPTVYGI